MIDERIKAVYVMGNGYVVVIDMHGEQMPQYQGRLPEVASRLERAYPRRHWHEWIAPQQCRCGLRLGEH